jgi:hypothetical protein
VTRVPAAGRLVEHLTLFDTYLENVEQDDSRKIYLAKHVLSLAEGAPRQNSKSEYRNPDIEIRNKPRVN